MDRPKIRFEQRGRAIYFSIKCVKCAKCGSEAKRPVREVTTPAELYCPDCGWLTSLTGDAPSALQALLDERFRELDASE